MRLVTGKRSACSRIEAAGPLAVGGQPGQGGAATAAGLGQLHQLLQHLGRASSMRRLLTGSPAEGRPEGGILALGLLAGISLGILAVCFQRLCLQIAVHHNNLVQARGIFSGGRSDQVVSVKAH